MHRGRSVALLTERRRVEHPLNRLWSYLASWRLPTGGVGGPVVHRGDLKRLTDLRDTAWTQAAVLEGTTELYRRTLHPYWLEQSRRLAAAQCRLLQADGSFAQAGHEDLRFSSLVHNALADRALLGLAEADPERADTYREVVRQNVESYLIGRLYSSALGGFKMNPVDYYHHQDTFIANMNSVALEVLLSTGHEALAREVAEQVLRLQDPCGAFRYSSVDPDHVSLYHGLTLRGLCRLYAVDHKPKYFRAVSRAVNWLRTMIDPATGLWPHRVRRGRLQRGPIFVAGAGIIGDALLEAAAIGVESPATTSDILLGHQLPCGGLRNFYGYASRGASRATPEVWEDVYPTTSWSAHAFSLLCRSLPPPEEPAELPFATLEWGSTWVHYESTRFSLVGGVWPPRRAAAAIFRKGLSFGAAFPGIGLCVRRLKKTPQR